MEQKKFTRTSFYAENLGEGNFAAMATKIFQCRKCGMTIQSNNTPTGTCPKGGFHSWAITYC